MQAYYEILGDIGVRINKDGERRLSCVPTVALIHVFVSPPQVVAGHQPTGPQCKVSVFRGLHWHSQENFLSIFPPQTPIAGFL